MKKCIVSIFLIAFTATALNAATITWNASLSKNGFDILNGTDLAVGSLVRVGTFNISDAVISANAGNVAFLDSNFVQAGFTSIGSGVGNAAGHFSLTSSNYANAVTLAGKQIYYWAFFSTNNATEATSISTATQIGIFYEPSGTNASWAFPTDVTLGSTTVSLSNLTDAATSTTKLPEAKAVVGTLGPGVSNTSAKPNFTLQPVPEPSTVAFLASGIMGLLGYRRMRRVV